MRTLERALRLARRGLPVFPCLPNKKPAVDNGFHAASVKPAIIRDWHWPGRLIGVPTGSRSGIAALDIDPRHGGDAWLDRLARRLPVGRAHMTRSGGTHMLFRWTEGLRNSAGLIAPGVDVRGEGGYVIWWPAHGCMVVDFVPLDELPEWPPWLTPERQRGGSPFAGNMHGRGVGDPYQVSLLARFVRESRHGERNNRLFWAACRLAEMRFERQQHVSNAAGALLHAALAVGLDGEEAARTIQSALLGG